VFDALYAAWSEMPRQWQDLALNVVEASAEMVWRCDGCGAVGGSEPMFACVVVEEARTAITARWLCLMCGHAEGMAAPDRVN
jgi:rubrerythrin